MDALQRKALGLGGWALGLAFLTIIGAWGFEIIGGYRPCPLCLQQRVPYYAGVPVLALGVILLLALWRRPRGRERVADAERTVPLVAAVLFIAGAGIFVWSAYLGIQHAGAEWGFWAMPASCGGALPATSGNLLANLQAGTARMSVPCDVVQWRFAGLSFAGWNGVVSVIVAILALRAGLAAWRMRGRPTEAGAVA